MGERRIVRDPHNLSHSRLGAFYGCPTRAGYESFYEGSKRTAAPYWLPLGGAVHHVIDQVIAKTIAAENPVTLNPDNVDDLVKKARGHIYRVLSGEIPPRGHLDKPTRLLPIMWMSPEEQQKLDPEQLSIKIEETIWRNINKVTPAIKAVALRCTIPSTFKWTKNGVRFDEKFVFTSPRDPQIKIPILGEIDLLEQHQNGGLIITDWKSGSFNYFLEDDLVGNEQGLFYWEGIRQLYGVNPIMFYFVSLSIFSGDVETHGAGALELERYRVQAKINYEQHFPKLLDEVDDAWAVLMFLAYPPRDNQERKLREDWQPRSELGKRVGLRRHLDENRLIPNIGRQCAMCPERPRCMADNPEDWEKYRARQKLGNVVNPLPVIPEEWLDPFQAPDESLLLSPEQDKTEENSGQLLLMPRKVLKASPLKRHTLNAKQWLEQGFLTRAQLVAHAKRMHDIIPVKNGQMCPCKRTERIPAFFIPYALAFLMEREEHKQKQEAQGKTRSGVGKDKVKDLFDSEVVRQILKQCPIEGCPFACKEKEQDDPIETKTPQTA